MSPKTVRGELYVPRASSMLISRGDDLERVFVDIA